MRFRRAREPIEGRVVPDDLPKDKIFAQPLVVSKLRGGVVEDVADTVEFRATVKDADGKRCPDLAVHATIVGPERTGEGMAHTDLMGVVRFRMTGPAGDYRCTITDVAAGALELDETASDLEAVTSR